MKRDTVAFGGPFLIIATGLVVLVAGIFQGGLTTLALIGGVVVLVGMLGLYTAAVRA